MKAAIIVAAWLIVFVHGCSGGSSGSGGAAAPASSSRRVLTYGDLFSSDVPSAPVDESAGFAFPATASPPNNTFEGTLTISDTVTGGSYHVVSDPLGYERAPAFLHLAPFSFQFVQSGNLFIPQQQGLVITRGAGAVWNYIVGPGKAWQEPADNGYTRVSFPFALVERNQNCVHNGEITFLFSNMLSPNISNVFYQVTQETCAYFKVDLWGQLPATYTPGKVVNDEALQIAAAADVSNRLPTKPFSALAADFPGSGIDVAAFTKAGSPRDITVYGVMVNGTNYASTCQTRYGNYAYCGEMRLPSYSVAKSAFAGTALMRLGQLYSSSVYDQLIKDWIPQYMDGGDWTGVTFDHASKMATGNFNSRNYMVDEDSQDEILFLGAEDFPTKIMRAFAPFPGKAPPGAIWVYQTHATFILTVAMQAYLQQQRGAGGDIFNTVRDDVFKPLKVSQGGLTTLRTDDSPTGYPLGGYGLFLNYDDIAKIGDFLNNGSGVIAGSQIIDNARLQESLFRATNPATLGLPVPDTGSPRVPNSFRYNDDFWAKHFTPAEFPQYSCDFWVPYMSGFGGITVLLLPDGVTYYIFSDGGEFFWYDAVNEINKIKPLCSQGSGA